MSALTDINELLNKYYKTSISIAGLQETVDEILSVDDFDSDFLFELIKECQSWERFLRHNMAIVSYYMSFFENKQDIIQSVIDEAKKDIKNGTNNCIAIAKVCKIKETEPEKILEAGQWLYKCNIRDLKVFKTFIRELGAYSKFFKANYFNCRKKYSQIRKSVDISSLPEFE